MLYRFIINNFKSFANEQQFDMFPNMRRDNFQNHILAPHDIPVLKEAAIYGANGCGKSNFVEALSFVKKMVTGEEERISESWLRNWFMKSRYRLPVNEEKNISFLIEFGAGNGMYIYYLEIGKDGVERENLYLSGKGKNDDKPLFTRTKDSVRFDALAVDESVRMIFERQIKDNSAMSVLGTNGNLHLVENEVLDAVYDWFLTKLHVIRVDRNIPWLIEQLNSDPVLTEYVNHVYSQIGLGIDDMSIRSSKLEDWLPNQDPLEQNQINTFLPRLSKGGISKTKDAVPVTSFTESNGVNMVRELIFKQFGQNGFVGEMGADAQSTGTLRLLTLIPALYYAVHKNDVVVIDEIDNSIHPILIKNLISYFGMSMSQGQLIYTTHETALLNQQELLRADEVWFAEKVDGSTQMYSLNDFKIHRTISIENGYLMGRFGAIPFLGTL